MRGYPGHQGVIRRARTAANRITICCAADYTMITMWMECAIGLEPMKSTLCRREPWPLGYAHGVAWDGFEPSRGLLQGQVGYQLPDQAEVSEEGFEPSTTRSQIGCAIQTALLAHDGWPCWPPERLA